MSSAKSRISGWQGASLVTITYVYFLIFAQFAFLKRLAALGIAETHSQAIMAAMALGGIAASLLAPRLAWFPTAALRLRAGLALSGAAAFLALLPLAPASAAAVSLLIGTGLGLLTVTLVTHLRQFTGNSNPLLAVGVGTGFGYLACNIPGFFNAPPQLQSLAAGVLCIAGIAITFAPLPAIVEQKAAIPQSTTPFLLALLGFTALVWLDSAAFFIIQSTPALKAGTWQGTLHLWSNGALHFTAALTSAWLLRRKGLMPVLIAAVAALGIACLLLRNPDQVLLASVFYPIGVSLYSVALVAYPALLAPAAGNANRGRIAGWLYAVAGWSGSAMGIGMGQHLGHVPAAFVFVAASAVLLPQLIETWRTRNREVMVAASVVLIAFLLHKLAPGVGGSASTPVERGRQVYISEGCIHCHSQYVRPHTSDVLMWGPATSIADVRTQDPPLIGNRRQGPDLAEVGARRSTLWLKAHFCNPAEVSGNSIMPSYAFLFRDERGDDLVAYLASLRTGDSAHQLAIQQAWSPSADDYAHADTREGEQLYSLHCATCHSANGATRRTWQSSFKHRPPDFTAGHLTHLSGSGSADELARTIRFGIAGTDMPGHEYLSDSDVASLSLWLQQQLIRNP